LINVDFAHIRQVIQMGGGALMSIGIGEGENKAFRAVEQALHHPLLESISIDGATGIIANFTGGPGLSFIEVTEALNHLQEMTHEQADIIPGVISDPRMEDRAQVILVITGLGATPVETALPARKCQEPELAQTVSAQSAVVGNPSAMAARPSSAGRLSAMGQPAARTQPEETPLEISGTNLADLDLPAFMRRKYR
jgi:cell division protein FtsZ